MEPKAEIAKPLLVPMLSLSNRQFKEQFGHLSGAWRGKKPIQRNAIIALAHFKEEESLEALVEVLQKDPRADMRAIAAWAIGMISGERAETSLRQSLEKERDEDVLAEIEKALRECQKYN